MKLKAFMVAALLVAVAQVQALTVVYVHGTSPNMTKQDAYDYWNGDEHQSTSSAPRFVNISRNGHNYYITYRDGRLHVKPQAIQLANQIYRNVSDSQIIIVAHSMGGLIARYIMANPSNDGLSSYQRYQFNVVRNKVRRIITLATPHLGSPAADLVNTLRNNWLAKPLVNWLGYDKDAMDHLTPSWCKSVTAGVMHPNNIKKTNGQRVHMYMLGSRDATAGESWYNRQWENWGLWAIDGVVNYNRNQTYPSKGSYYDRFPSENKCTKRYWWGGCKKRATVYGDSELDNDGMVSAWSGNLGNYSNSYLHKYTSYDSHHTNRYKDSVAYWAKGFVY